MNNFITILKKELLDIFRDKKTLILTIFLPIIIYPAMFSFMSSSINNLQDEAEKEINIYIEGDTKSSVADAILSIPAVNLVETDTPQDLLKKGDIQLIIQIPDKFDENIMAGKNDKITILIDEESNKSMIAESMINEILESYKNNLVAQRLAASGLDTSILSPFTLEVKSGINEGEEANNFSSMMMSMLPTLIIILMISSTIGMAADLGAGEKERFTFEPLLSTSANRSSIITGKIVALCVVAFISLVANVFVMAFSMGKFMNFGGEVDININLYSILGILLIGVLVLIFLATLQISISIYARSTKEANSYLAAITMPSMLLAFIPYMADAKSINPAFFNIPITNSICLMKEFIVGIYDFKHILMVVCWHLLYILISITFVRFMFSREEVIFRT
ncbi:ABC transporter permease [Caproiciproducens sp. MSJ-32]|uniref:ABC transporter permease n=1 Tax=Caproiciproducens sp. MSJ-32 TaxID=2841527 RepID=UPI001C1292C8|nr:ABC transporter permease [Caproiciproducens sp. MSJ-32]MBU5453954.1 ABC transporter permease [Caproiciproducens sp. MSJ-32]